MSDLLMFIVSEEKVERAIYFADKLIVPAPPPYDPMEEEVLGHFGCCWF